MSAFSDFWGGLGKITREGLAILSAVFGAIGRFFNSLFQAELQIQDNLIRVRDNFERGKKEIQEGIDKIKHFKFEPNWKTRVIWVPDVIDTARMIYEKVFSDFRERLSTIAAPIHDLALIFRAEASEAGSGQEAVSGLSKTAVKIDEVATMIKQLADATDEVMVFIDFFDETISDIQNLDKVFLPQNSKRTKTTETYFKRS